MLRSVPSLGHLSHRIESEYYPQSEVNCGVEFKSVFREAPLAVQKKEGVLKRSCRLGRDSRIGIPEKVAEMEQRLVLTEVPKREAQVECLNLQENEENVGTSPHEQNPLPLKSRFREQKHRI